MEFKGEQVGEKQKDIHYCVATSTEKALEVASMGRKQRPTVVAQAGNGTHGKWMSLISFTREKNSFTVASNMEKLK